MTTEDGYTDEEVTVVCPRCNHRFREIPADVQDVLRYIEHPGLSFGAMAITAEIVTDRLRDAVIGALERGEPIPHGIKVQRTVQKEDGVTVFELDVPQDAVIAAMPIPDMDTLNIDIKDKDGGVIEIITVQGTPDNIHRLMARLQKWEEQGLNGRAKEEREQT